MLNDFRLPSSRPTFDKKRVSEEILTFHFYHIFFSDIFILFCSLYIYLYTRNSINMYSIQVQVSAEG